MDLAWKDLSKAYEIDPTYYWTVFYVGLTAYELNDPTTAIALINEAIKLENRFEPHQCLAKIYFNLNNFDKAIEHCNKAIQLDPEKAVSAKQYLALSQQLLKMSNELDAFQWNQFDEKIAKATEILKIKPDHSKALFFRGHAYYTDKKEMDLAWKDLCKAYEIDPQYYWTVYYVGLTAYELHDSTTAITFIHKAAELEARFEPHQSLAQIYFNLNNFDKAIEHSNKAIQLNSKKAEIATRAKSQTLKRFIKELELITSKWGYWDEKIAKANEILKIKPDHELSLCRRGHAYYYKSEFQLAFNDFSVLDEMSPNNVYYLRHLGFCYESTQEYGHAIKYFEKAQKLNPKDHTIKEDLIRVHSAQSKLDREIKNLHEEGYALDGSKKFSEAIAKYNQVIALQPNHHEARFRRARCLNKLGKKDLALIDYNICIAQKPTYYYTNRERGIILAESKEYEKATPDLLKAAELWSLSGRPIEEQIIVLTLLDAIYAKSNKFSQAIESYEALYRAVKAKKNKFR